MELVKIAGRGLQRLMISFDLTGYLFAEVLEMVLKSL